MDILTVDTLAQALQESNRPLLTQVLRVLGQAAVSPSSRTRSRVRQTAAC
jgi:hypothetical protein